MKTLATIFLTASLFIGSSIFAQDKFSAFYPPVDSEASSYASLHESIDTSGVALSLDSMDGGTLHAKSNPITEPGVSALYPLEDAESGSFAMMFDSADTSDAVLSLDSRTRSVVIDTSFDAFYPIEDDDSSSY